MPSPHSHSHRSWSRDVTRFDRGGPGCTKRCGRIKRLTKSVDWSPCQSTPDVFQSTSGQLSRTAETGVTLPSATPQRNFDAKAGKTYRSGRGWNSSVGDEFNAKLLILLGFHQCGPLAWRLLYHQCQSVGQNALLRRVPTMSLDSINLADKTLKFGVLASALALILTTGCSTKNYVRSQTGPLIQQTNELDSKTAQGHRDITDTDRRAQAGIANADVAASTADQHAQAAGQSAE